MPPASPCTLRINPETGIKGPVHSQIPATANTYNKNFQNRFCGCGEIHNPYEEKGTMFQCLGLSNEQDGGCGEDWWHPECVLGLGRDWLEGTQLKTAQSDPPDDANVEENEEPVHPLPHGFPQEDEFESFICYKCVDANPWIKRYAGSSGFLMPVFRKMLPLPAGQPQQPGSMRLSDESAMDEKRQGENGRTSPASALSSPVKIFADAQVLDDTGNRALQTNTGWMDRQTANIEKASTPESSTNAPTISKKRKAEDVPEDSSCPKRPKDDTPPPRHQSLAPAPDGSFSIFLQEDFRDHLCRCPTCYLVLRKYPQLLEEEVVYEPPLSQNGEEGGGGESVATGSLLDRGEAALSNVDRVRAIGKIKAIRAPISDILKWI